jgi:VWFA-related protein
LLNAQDTQHSPRYHAPALTVTTRIVVLDVVVTDKKGNLVKKELTRDDFTVYEDKQPQHVLSFEPPSEHAMPDSGRAVVSSAADLRKVGDAPVTILVLDELNSHFEDMSYSRQMLVKYLGAQPKVLSEATALMLASNSTLQQIHDYTQDRDTLIEIVKKHIPEVPWKLMNGGNGGAGAAERMAQVLAALEEVAKASTGTPGRKNLIWVGNGFPTADLAGLDARSAKTIETAIRRCTTQLLAARVTMYTINPTADSSSTVDAAEPDDFDALAADTGTDPLFGGTAAFANLAPATGGIAFTGRNDLNNVIGEGIAKGQEYYTLSYSPTNHSLDAAKFRRIRIVMKDPNLRATTRDGYYPVTASDLNPMMAKDVTARQARATLQLDLSTALTTMFAYNGLNVSVTKAGRSGWKIDVAEKGIEWSDPDANGAQHTEDTLAAGWYNSKGKLSGHIATEKVAMRANPSNGATYLLTVPAAPDAARLRFVVRDAVSGRMGTVDVTKF